MHLKLDCGAWDVGQNCTSQYFDNLDRISPLGLFIYRLLVTVYSVFSIICHLVFGAAVSMPRSKKGKRGGNSSSKGEFICNTCCHSQ